MTANPQLAEPDGTRDAAQTPPALAKGAVSVSVVVPVYNSKRYLRECLDSIAKQTQKDIEVICVDDGSTDGSPDILKKFAKKDGRFKVVRQKNQGPSVARNTGIALARGEYLGFVDSDDWLEHDALERLVSLADSMQLDHIAFSAEAFCDKDYENGAWPNTFGISKAYAIPEKLALKPMSGVDLAYLLLENQSYYAVVWAHFLRLSVVRRSALSFPPGLLHEDEYFTPISLVVSERAVALSDMLYHRRMRRNSIMTTLGMENIRMQNCLELARKLKEADGFGFASDSRERQFLNRRAKSIENSAVKYSEALPLGSLSPAEVNSIMAIYRRIRSENQEKRIAAEKKEAAEITALREKLSAAEAKRAAAEAKVEVVNAKLVRRDEWLAAAKKKSARAEAKRASAEAKVEALNAKIARRDEWLAAEKKNADRAEAKLAAEKAKVEVANAKIARRDEWLAVTKTKSAKLQTQLEAMKLRAADLTAANHSKDVELARLRKEAARLAKVESVVFARSSTSRK